MKRIVAITLLVLTFSAMFMGCKQKETKKHETEKYNEQIAVSRNNHLTEDWYYDMGDEGYAVPQFNVRSDTADQLNLELEEKYKDIAKKGKDSGYLYVKMQGSVYKNMAFILVETTLKDKDPLFEVYAISLNDGSIPKNNDVLACFNVSKATGYGSVKDALSNEYKMYFHSFSDSSYGAYKTNRDKTLSDENVYGSTLFINERSQLSLVGTLYSIDGETKISRAITALDPPLKKNASEG